MLHRVCDDCTARDFLVFCYLAWACSYRVNTNDKKCMDTILMTDGILEVIRLLHVIWMIMLLQWCLKLDWVSKIFHIDISSVPVWIQEHFMPCHQNEVYEFTFCFTFSLRSLSIHCTKKMEKRFWHPSDSPELFETVLKMFVAPGHYLHRLNTPKEGGWGIPNNQIEAVLQCWFAVLTSTQAALCCPKLCLMRGCWVSLVAVPEGSQVVTWCNNLRADAFLLKFGSLSRSTLGAHHCLYTIFRG